MEIGGTVGDIESQPFLEAIRQVAAERGRQNVMFIHVSLIVSIPGSSEFTQRISTDTPFPIPPWVSASATDR